ncbi:MAG: DUF5694 domain-containing protein [Lysobacterales bacterium]|jgi:hypothetical protein
MKFLPALLALLFALPLQADETTPVLVLGTFHFSNPGLDVVKQEDFDVMSPESQAYLEALSQRLAGFRPTRVLLEFVPADDEKINERYRAYLADEFELPVNEIYQLGFRVAKRAGNERVYPFDNRDVEWQSEAMFEYAKAHDSPEMAAFNEIIGKFTKEDAEARATLSLRGLLLRTNDPQLDRINMDLYLATNAIGAGDGYVGAQSTSSWWARNFRMYANLQQLAGPDQRVIVIAGQGHTAILKQLLAIDRRLKLVEVQDFL